MTPYILQVALIIAGCLAFYKILLQKETFYRVNRFILISCLVVAFALPLLPMPQKFSFRKAEEKTYVQIPPINPVESTEPAKKAADESVVYPQQVATNTPDSGFEFSFSKLVTWLTYLYWFGVIAFGLSFLLQVVVLFYRAYRSPVIIDGRYRIVEISGDKAPCSFGNNIFINPEKYEWETYNQILQHEKVHIRQKHSMDLLLAEFVLIFQWFNPFAWIYRKEMENNLEFLTDAHLVDIELVEKSSYQISLLKVSTPQLPLSITTNYNQSLLKKRIAMMNTKKSNLHTAWKYFFLLPLLVLFASVLNEPVAQSKAKETSDNSKKNIDVQVSENVKQQSNQQVSQNIDNQVKESVNVSKSQQSKNNTNVQTDINTNISSNVDAQVKANQQVNVEQSVKNKTNFSQNGKGIDTEGSWFATIKDDRISFQFRADDERDSYNSSSFKLSEFPNLPKGTAGTFKLTREAGVMEFTGKFEGDQGMGKYKFVADKQYTDDMNKELDETLKERDVMVFFFIDIKRSYVKMIKAEGYKDVNKNDIIPLAALKVDQAFISSMKASGLKDLDTKDLIPLKSLEIDQKYIQEIRAAGIEDLTPQQTIALKAQKIDGDYIRRVKQSADKPGKEMDVNDIIALKSLKIDDAYINSFKEVGLTNISSKDIIPMKSLGITADFVKGFHAIGYKNLDPKDLIPLKAQKVSPEFVKGFEDLGFKDIPVHDIISLKAVGVTPAYVKDMKAKGFNYTKLNKYITLKSMGDN